MSVAVFVDAGYLKKAGLAAVTGSAEQPGETGRLDLPGVVAKLRAVAGERTGDARLLRIYWYDGMLRGRPSPEQDALAYMDDVKLRLGVVRDGRQKGVDSLIVTDLIELARNHAISDAVLLSGDEDLRIAVQIAQSFGARVHLVGIEPSRSNQSSLLMQEADATSEWSREEIGAVLSFDAGAIQFTAVGAAQADESVAAILDEVIDGFLDGVSAAQLNEIAALAFNSPVPRNYDASLLAASGERVGRDLTEPEKRYIRSRVKEQAAAKIVASG